MLVGCGKRKRTAPHRMGAARYKSSSAIACSPLLILLRAAPSTARRNRVTPANDSFHAAVCSDLITLRIATLLSDVLMSVQPASIDTVKLAPNIGLVSCDTTTVKS